ncbi:MAG TPA: hypothetical protein VNX21_00510 [Candidatus Thermoplasmatota archaeon]|nr:hypothetical protein [Candidatus Thermoplasmatota archaeon]
MPDLWDNWDRRVKATGRPSRVASDLTDAELVRLLGSETTGRQHERRVLCDELYARLARPTPETPVHRFPEEASTWPHVGPEAGP